MSHHQTTPATIKTIWTEKMWPKLRRDLSWLCNLLHSMLSPVPHVAVTTWPSETVTEPPWWRRGAAPPCRPTQLSAQVTSSSFTSRLTEVVHILVGASAGVQCQWHRVSAKICQSKDMLLFCKIVFFSPRNHQSDNYINIESLLIDNALYFQRVSMLAKSNVGRWDLEYVWQWNDICTF